MAVHHVIRAVPARQSDPPLSHESPAIARYRAKAAHATDLARAALRRGNRLQALGLFDAAECFRAFARALERSGGAS